MKVKKCWILAAVLGVGVLGVLVYCFKIKVYTIELHGKGVDSFIQTGFFEGLRPDMGKSEVTSILGKPSQIYIGENPEYEDDPGERWEYIRADGVINYYFEHNKPDGGIGSPEYVPRDLNRDELFKTAVPEKCKQEGGKYIIELRDKNRMLTVRLLGDKVERINYYEDYITQTIRR